MTAVGAMIMREVAPEECADHAWQIAPGLDELWLVEDLGWAGGVAQLATVLGVTDEIAVGHGIAPAPLRNPALLAMEWATLARTHPGRLRLGLGHGVPAWMRAAGAAVESPLTLLRETLDAVRGLLGGERVRHEGRYVRLRDVELEFPPAEVPPILVGATGPASMDVAGAAADGVVLPGTTSPEAVDAARTAVDRARSASGRPGTATVVVFAEFFVGDPTTLGPAPPGVPLGWDAIAPNPSGVADELGHLVDAGADAVVLVPIGPDRVHQLRLAATDIAPALRLR